MMCHGLRARGAMDIPGGGGGIVLKGGGKCPPLSIPLP